MDHSSVSWDITLLYFLAETLYHWTKGVYQFAKFQTFDCSHEILPYLYFDRLLLLEVYKISAKKKCKVFMSHDPEGWCKIWKKTDSLFQKWQKFGEIRLEHSKVFKMCTLMGSFWAKYTIFELKK